MHSPTNKKLTKSYRDNNNNNKHIPYTLHIIIFIKEFTTKAAGNTLYPVLAGIWLMVSACASRSTLKRSGRGDETLIITTLLYCTNVSLTTCNPLHILIDNYIELQY